MNVVIIGSGNVAAVFGRKLVMAGHDILQVLSRNAAEATRLAYEWNTESANYNSLINKNADVYILAVSDSALPDFARDLRLPGKVVVHTAASQPKDILDKISTHYGVIYPLQSLNKKRKEIPEIPVFTDASDDYTSKIIEKIAIIISGEKHHEAGFDYRSKMHVAAVVVNNFTNHLFTLAAAYCRQENLDFKELLPLIENTVDKLKEEAPQLLQTGPAMRGDWETIKRHKDYLKVYPPLLEVYEQLTESIQKNKSLYKG